MNTKADIELIRREIKELEATTKLNIEELAASTRRDLKELEYRLTIRLGGMMVVGVAAAPPDVT